MPTYTYTDPETGVEIDVKRPLADRDKPIVLVRKSKVPDRVGVVVPGAAVDPFAESLRRGYQRLESEGGSRFRSEHSKKDIKKVLQS